MKIKMILVAMVSAGIAVAFCHWRASQSVHLRITYFPAPFAPSVSAQVDGSVVSWKYLDGSPMSLLVESTNPPMVLRRASNSWMIYFTDYVNTNFHRVELPVFESK